MKKIIAAIDGLKPSDCVQEYAIFLAKQENAHLVGIFLDDITYLSLAVRDLVKEGGILDKQIELLQKKDKKTRDYSVKRFEESCSRAGLNFSIHHDKNIAIQDLLHECVYADLLVLSAHETFSPFTESAPTRFVREILADVQCPVLLVPKIYWPVEKLALLYDGGTSSVYAIKMFDYVLPTFKEMSVEVISVKSSDESLHLPDNKLMKELMKRHYPRAKYTILKGEAGPEIVRYLRERNEHALTVLGAYRRSSVSRWLSTSMADILMKKLKMPLFIAHNK
ncbi:MAG TPA: universal stress protein [Chitinophagaceae bacterium]